MTLNKKASKHFLATNGLVGDLSPANDECMTISSLQINYYPVFTHVVSSPIQMFQIWLLHEVSFQWCSMPLNDDSHHFPTLLFHILTVFLVILGPRHLHFPIVYKDLKIWLNVYTWGLLKMKIWTSFREIYLIQITNKRWVIRNIMDFPEPVPLENARIRFKVCL